MADDKRSHRKPLSLNDRHYRLLQDLSAPPKPSAPEVEERPSKVKHEGRRGPCKASAVETVDCDISRGIADFDSPPEEKPRKVKIEGRRRLCKVSSRDDGSAVNRPKMHDKPGFSDITDFDSPSPAKKTDACFAYNQGANEFAQTRVVLHDEPRFSSVTDFDSPSPVKRTADCGQSNGGASEIRDILNDLSSRLDLLSIDKEWVPACSDKVVEDPCRSMGDGDQEHKNDVPEYMSAGFSFSRSSDLSNSSPDVTKNVGTGAKNVVDSFEDEEGHFLSESREEYSVDQMHGTTTNNSRRLKKDENGRVEELSSFMGSVDEEEESDCCSECESGNNATTVAKINKSRSTLNKTDPKRMHERLRYAGRSFTSALREEIEEEQDEDDCMILSNKRPIKDAVRSEELSYESSVIDVPDDYINEAVSEHDDSVTFIGPEYTYRLPGKIAKMLYPHQHEGLRWLWSLHCQGKGGILGDDMGLGKTMQICSFLAGLFSSRLIRRALVVAPKTLLSHWIKELSIVGLSGTTREYFGTSAKARQYELQYILQDKGILLTTYDIVRNNSKSLRGLDYFSDEESDDPFTWDYMILDEGHLIKNPNTQRAKSLLEIPSAHRIVISGTPIQNNLKELWALFNFCCPDLLGDYKWFKEKYEHAILRGNEKNASDREKCIGSMIAKELRERIQPYFLRRLKNEVFNEEAAGTAKLSKKNEIIVWLRLTSCQQQLYEAFLQSELVLSAFDGSPLAALTILKKICDHPLLLTKRAAEDVLEGMDSMLNSEDASVAEKLAMHVADVAETTTGFQEKHNNVSCKISFILSLMDNLIPEGHSVLIFSQTRKMLNLVQESLVSKGYELLRIDGTTKASDRVKIVNGFQEGMGASILLLTSQVGGLGLTLTRADRVIVVDPAWNPSTDNQSVDRAYRIGQKKDVIVYRLMTCGTVEEKIYRKQIFKGGLFKSATEHKEQVRYFSQQDLRELFSLPKQGFDISLTQQQLHEEHDCQHKMDASLEAHIKFLETQGIAGVSHHSLLFSKTAPVQVVQDEEGEIRRGVNTFVGYSLSSSSEPIIDGAVHAFNPKDVKLHNKKSSSPVGVGKMTESEIKERINRLSQLLANKVTVSRLPDQGAKLHKQILDLNLELDKLAMGKRADKKVIDLDDLTGELQRVLNV